MWIGAGNAVFPLLAANENPHLRLKAYDYSSHAVKLVQVGIYLPSTTASSDRATEQPLIPFATPRDDRSRSLGSDLPHSPSRTGARKR